MEKLTLTRALRNQLRKDNERDVRIDDSEREPRILDDLELALAAGGDETPHG